VLAGTLTYWNARQVPFIFDDWLSVVDNPYLRGWWRHLPSVLFPEREMPASGRPIPAFSFAINYALGGLNVEGYHVWNLAVHLCCGLLLFGTIRRALELPNLGGRLSGRSTDVAFACALLWTLHPLNTEVVNYVSQRMESMMAVFYLLTIYSSIRAHGSARAFRWQTLAVVASVLGLLSKETMATAPVLVILFDSVFVYGSIKEAFRSRRGFYLCLVATWLVLPPIMWTGPRNRSTGFSIGLSPWTYLLNQTVVITHYLRQVVWPRSLVLMYGPTLPLQLSDVLPHALFITSLLVATAVALIRAPAIGFLGAWFFVTLAPASSFVPILTEVGADRRMYLPLAGLLVLAIVGGSTVWDRVTRTQSTRTTSVAWALLLAGVSLAASAGTIARNREYASPLTLAETTLDRWPTAFAHRMFGIELIRAGRGDEGADHLRTAVEQGESRALYDLGIHLFNTSRLDESIERLEAFVHEEPALLEVVEARMTLGRAYTQQKKWPQAAGQFRALLAIMPSYLDARLRLAEVYTAQESFADAIAQYQEYLKMRPEDPGAITSLAIALMSAGRNDEALTAFRRAVEVAPRDAGIRRNLATILYDFRNLDEAEAQALEAVTLSPSDPAAHDLLGRVLALQGKFDEARAEFERALQIDPAYVEARQHLERVLGR
jgi:tetratricopeptide (TPR) repeat protein